MDEDERADLLTDIEDVVRKERAKAIPVPLCCPEAPWVVCFSLRDGPHWYIPTRQEALPGRGGPSFVRVKVCPCCATELPPVRLKEKPPTPMTAVDDEDYCSACQEKLIGCCCYHPHAAYEVVINWIADHVDREVIIRAHRESPMARGGLLLEDDDPDDPWTEDPQRFG